MRTIQVLNRFKVRYLISVPVVIIVLLNIQLITQIKDFNTFSPEKSSALDNQNWTQTSHKNNLTTIQHFLNSSHLIQPLQIKIEKLNSESKIKNKFLIESILQNEIKIQNSLKAEKNNEQKSYKMPKFFVILIQVHSRLNYLKELINSLKETKYIEQTLLVFSHDIYNEEMNNLINSIDFCAVIKKKKTISIFNF